MNINIPTDITAKMLLANDLCWLTKFCDGLELVGRVSDGRLGYTVVTCSWDGAQGRVVRQRKYTNNPPDFALDRVILEVASAYLADLNRHGRSQRTTSQMANDDCRQAMEARLAQADIHGEPWSSGLGECTIHWVEC
jgi:hypothetical protein